MPFRSRNGGVYATIWDGESVFLLYTWGSKYCRCSPPSCLNLMLLKNDLRNAEASAFSFEQINWSLFDNMVGCPDSGLSTFDPASDSDGAKSTL